MTDTEVKPVKKGKPNYTPEQKTEYIAYATEHTVKEASEKFNVSASTINNWRKETGVTSAKKEPISHLDFIYEQALKEPGAKEALVEWYKNLKR